MAVGSWTALLRLRTCVRVRTLGLFRAVNLCGVCVRVRISTQLRVRAHTAGDPS